MNPYLFRESPNVVAFPQVNRRQRERRRSVNSEGFLLWITIMFGLTFLLGFLIGLNTN